jgi:hypothetical protein
MSCSDRHSAQRVSRRRSAVLRMSGIIADAEVTRGMRAAGQLTLPLQRAHFEAMFAEMRKGLHWATLNLKLDVPVRIKSFDFETTHAWEGPGVVAERFGFIRIEIECPIGEPRRPALIYVPHNSPHFSNRHQIEVITSKIEGISYGTRCRVYLPESHVTAV